MSATPNPLTALRPPPLSARLPERDSRQHGGGGGNIRLQLDRAIHARQQSDIVIAYLANRMREDDGFRREGYGTQNGYFTSHGINRWLWHKYLRIGKLLRDIPLPTLLAVPPQNARKLLDVHPSIWLDYPWIDEATRLPVNKFAGLVNERTRMLPGGSRRPIYYRCRTTLESRDAIESAVLSFKQAHDLPDVGTALELLVTGANDDRLHRIMTDIGEVLEKLRGVRISLGKRQHQVGYVKKRAAAAPKRYKYRRINKEGKLSGKVLIPAKPGPSRAMIVGNQLRRMANSDARHELQLASVVDCLMNALHDLKKSEKRQAHRLKVVA